MTLCHVEPVMGVEVVDLRGEREGRAGQGRGATVEEEGGGVLCVRRSEEARGMVAGDAAAVERGGPGSDAERIDQQRRGGIEGGVGDLGGTESEVRDVVEGHVRGLSSSWPKPCNGIGDIQDLQCLEQHRLIRRDHRFAKARFDIGDRFDGAHVGAGQDEGLSVGVVGTQGEGHDVPGRQRALTRRC
jgi:hypothetical protein